MNVNRFKTDVKIHQINIKTSIRLSESFKLFKSFELSKFSKLSEKSSSELSKIYLNSSRTSTDEILNEMNDFKFQIFRIVSNIYFFYEYHRRS